MTHGISGDRAGLYGDTMAKVLDGAVLKRFEQRVLISQSKDVAARQLTLVCPI